MNLRDQVLRGLSWSFLSRFGSQVSQLVIGIILARMLSPNEFGIIGMLLVFTGFAQTFVDGGLGSALIYHRDIGEVHRSSVFWLQLGAGIILFWALFFAAPLVADFYAEPVLAPLSRLVAAVFILQALTLTQNALLSREFRFKTLGISSLAATLGSGVIAVVMAHLGLGVWALAWQPVLSAAIQALVLWRLSPWRPHLTFDRKSAAELGRYGLYLAGHNTLNYWQRNGDNLLIGKILGAHPLGIYARAYSLMLLPLTNIGAVFGQVMFPALSQLQADIPRFRQHYLSATQAIAFFAFPLMAGVAILSRPLILLLLGPKWIEVVPVLQILSLVGLFQSIIFPVGWVYTALGRTRDQFHLSLFLCFAFAATMVAGIRFGLLGVTYAYATWSALSGYLNLRLVSRYMESSIVTILLSVASLAGLSALMAVALWGFDHLVAWNWPLIVRLLVDGIVGVGFYGAACTATDNETFASICRIAGKGISSALLRSPAKGA
ncbi:MAG: MOP flippase family protein [Alphaproteobacteria bacterium]|nr:MOP flippase family protein [Alphaproteobacteria bacterium]